MGFGAVVELICARSAAALAAALGLLEGIIKCVVGMSQLPPDQSQ